MPRKRLTAQDAFIGVRRPPTEKQPKEPDPVLETPPDDSEKAEEPAQDPGSAEEAGPERRSASSRRTPTPSRQLATALREAQKAAAARAAVERLTLYLPADLAGQLSALWEQVREGTQIKVGKSLLAAAALRIVLADASLRANAAAVALREKLGQGPEV